MRYPCAPMSEPLPTLSAFDPAARHEASAGAPGALRVPGVPTARRHAGQRLLDALLTTDPPQRLRLAHTGLAMLLLAAGVLAMHWFAAVGVAQGAPVAWWSVISLGGMLVFYVLIRSGWSRRCANASLTVPQMLFALTSGAVAYTLVGAGRGGVFPIVMVVLMFGMFTASPRQMLGVSAYAVAVFGSAMLVMAWRDPLNYPPAVELGHFLMVATMMPAVSWLAGRMSRLRQRARQQRSDLAQALSRIRELATRDELTGLVNRRHMGELMAQEHQRCIRNGQTFCVGLLDIDRFKAFNALHGHSVGDVVLRAVAHEAQRQVRASDLLSHWRGGEFLLMLPDTRVALARGGLERLHQRLGALRIVLGAEAVSITLSAGLVEHIAGESVEQTVDRAKRLLQDAKAQGRNRVVVAG